MPIIYMPKKETKRNDCRSSRRRKIYQSQRWRILRQTKLNDNPLCEMCYKNGVIKSAIDVHHIKSFVDAEDEFTMIHLAYDYDNLMSLCKECHQLVHNKRGMG